MFKDVIQDSRPLFIRFPQRDEEEVAQDAESCEVVDGDHVTQVRFHDYAQTFRIPGLYDQLFGGPDSATKCTSPQTMGELLKKHLPRLVGPADPGEGGRAQHTASLLRVLDFGAGNGMMGEQVRRLVGSHGDAALAGSTRVVGLDILREAERAAERDRPGVYDAYFVADVTRSAATSPGRERDLEGLVEARFNVLVSASALGFGDAAAAAFQAATSFVQDGGLVLFNVRADLLDDCWDSTGAQEKRTGTVGSVSNLAKFLQQAVDDGHLEVLETKKYRHRFSVTGKPLYYVAVVAVKHVLG